MPPSRPYRGVSASERRAERRTALSEAALALVVERGLGAVTVNAVCAAAGLSKRYFYESFTDLDGLLVDALDGLLTDTRQRIRAALSQLGPEPRGRARVTVESLVDALTRDPRLARLYVEAPGHPGLHQRRERAFDEYATLLNIEVFGVDDGPARHAAALFIVSGATQVVTTWLAGRVELDRDQLVAVLTTVGTIPRSPADGAAR